MKLLAVVTCTLALSAIASAQESRAAIIGRVMDASGAVTVGARVHAVNVEMNTGGSSVTNAEGNYEIPYLLPGIYKVTAELAGFKKAVRDGIELRVSDRLTLDFTLEVGSVTDSVVVTGETPLLESATASLGMVMDERRVSELPIVGGNAFYLSRMSPGINTTGGHTAGNPSDFGVATTITIVNGTRSGSSEVTLDGSPNMYENSAAFAPPQDLVQEFRIQTTTFDASQGHATGAVVNVSMKSGTNALHGTSYYFDSRIRSIPWFSNRWLYDTRTGPIDDAKRKQANPGWLHQRWGDTFSGPVYIPRLYDGRNRTFWTFGYEGLYIRRQTSFTGTVPTPEQQKGDFSPLLAISKQYQIYDPLTIAPAAAGRFSRQPLAGNVVPPSRINPVAQKIVSYWPAPNTPGTIDGRQNFFRIASENKDYRSLVGRIDQSFGDNHRVFFRINQNVYDVRQQNLPTIAQGDITHHPGWGAVLDDVYVFSPQLLLNVRYGINLQDPKQTRYSQGFDLLSLGFPRSLVSEIRAKNDPAGIAFPELSVDGYTGLGTGGGNGRVMTYQNLGATLTRISGNHSVRAGGEFRLMRENGFSWGNVAPRLEFSNFWTRGPLDTSPGAPMGQTLASMLLGIPSGGRVNINASRAEQSTFSAIFLQDDWKVTRRLTVNLGLRYEYEGPTTERFNHSLRGFDFKTPSPIEQEARANYARAPMPELPVESFRALGGLTFAGVGGQPRPLWAADKNNFAPRLGLAYQLTPKSVLRAGYGVFFDMLGIDQRDVNQGGFNQATNLIPSLDNGLHFVATLSDPFPNGFQLPIGAAGGLSTNLGRGVSYFDSVPLNPYMQRWSFSVQRELPQRILMEVSYVGNRGTKLMSSKEQDAVPARYFSRSPARDQAAIDFLNEQVSSPFNGIADFVGTGLGNVRINRAQLLRPYPHFTGITADLPIGYSYYHSLQMHTEKRLAKGLTFQASWTWSKFIECVNFLNDSDPAPEKVISDQDFPHRFTLSAIYDLPFGRGRPLAPNAGRLLNSLIGGWQVQASYEGQSGQAPDWGNIVFYGNLHDVPIPVRQRTVERWFNIDAGFERDVQKQLGSNIRRFSTRFNNIRGDGINNFDMSLFKNFPLREKLRAQFRIESYNAMNHPQFANPNNAPTSTAFGTITGEKGHGQRQLTFAVKLLF